MRIQTIILTLVFSLFTAVAIAGSGHSHDPVSQIQAEGAAIKSVARLADKGSIDKSWKSASVAKTEKKKFGKNMEWVVSFNNKNISDPKKQTDSN